eukprot:3591623-Pyramimonas_sp.AAC.1
MPSRGSAGAPASDWSSVGRSVGPPPPGPSGRTRSARIRRPRLPTAGAPQKYTHAIQEGVPKTSGYV